jgi:hypothetical protein
VPFDIQLGDFGRVHRENSLYTFTGYDATNGEVFTGSAAATGNHNTSKNLDAFLVTFLDTGMHVDGIADFELKRLFTKA